jgi:hypothetical protein
VLGAHPSAVWTAPLTAAALPLWPTPYARGGGRTRVSDDRVPLRSPVIRVRPCAEQDPQRGGECGEIRQHRQQEGDCREDPKLPHRRKVAESEGEKATGVDERREDDRPTGNAQRVTQRRLDRAVPPLIEEVIEEMDLIVL